MRRRDRPVPFPWPSTAYRAEFKRLREQGHSAFWTRHLIRDANHKARMFPLKGEKCLAYARSTGKPCQAPAGWNGRCRVHGSSQGPVTEEGRRRALANLKQFRTANATPPPAVAKPRQRSRIVKNLAFNPINAEEAEHLFRARTRVNAFGTRE